MKKLVSLLVALLLLACNSAYAQQYFVLPQGTTVNACPTDATTAQKADVYDAINPFVWTDPTTLGALITGTPVKANDGYVYAPVGSFSSPQGVAKLTTTGVLVGSLTLPNSLIVGNKICLGPDGRLWCASPGTKTVIAWDPSSGVSSTYVLATTNNFPAAGNASTPAIVGADGNLWFFDALLTRLVVVNTSGALVTQYVVPAAAATGANLTLGADGRLFYASTTGVTAVDTAGTATTYASVTPSTPIDLFAASNSALYVRCSSGFAKIDTSGNLLNTYLLAPERQGLGATSGYMGTAVEVNKVVYMCDLTGRLYGIDMATDRLKLFRSLSLPQTGYYASFDNASIIALANGVLYKLVPGGSVSSTLALNGEKVSSNNPVPVYSAGTTKSCYVVGAAFSPGSATVTDVFTMSSSTGAKIIKILRVEIWAVTGSANTFDCYLIKRSAGDTGGTSSAITTIPLDSEMPNADAQLLQYTANPAALGSAIGTIAIRKVLSSTATATSRSEPIILFDQHTAGAPITLRLSGSTSQTLAINFNGVAKPAQFNLGITVYWTEE